MVHVVTQTRDREEGAVAIIVALLAIVLFGFCALVVDVGHAQDVRHNAQNAVDSGALAGAQELRSYLADPANVLPDDNLADVVQRVVDANLPNPDWSSCAAPDPASGFTASTQTNCVQWAPADGSNPVRVRVEFPPRKVPTTFGGIVGVGSITVDPVAVSAVGNSTGTPPCEPCNPAINPLPVPHPQTQPLPSPTPTLTATPSPSPPPSLSPSSAPSIAPPSSAPPSSAPPSSGPPNGDCPTAPGFYSGDLDLGVCSLGAPGLYVFDGKVTADALTGSHVTLWFQGSGTLDVGGALHLVATDAAESPVADELPGFAVVFAQGDSESFHLGATFDVTGSVYAFDATWHVEADECPAVIPPQCRVQPGVIAVTNVQFDSGLEPTVKGDVTPTAPQPPHLVK